MSLAVAEDSSALLLSDMALELVIFAVISISIAENTLLGPWQISEDISFIVPPSLLQMPMQRSTNY